MNTYTFPIACVSAEDGRTPDEITDALFEAGCDDALLLERAGMFVLEFDRDADSFDQAAVSAIHDVFSAGMKPTYLGPDPMVSMSDIAERAGITRQAVSLYVSGRRGSGFPPPIAKIDSPSPLWEWLAVAEWLHAKGTVDEHAVEAARSVHRIREQMHVDAA
jgi:hypothetical protein